MYKLCKWIYDLGYKAGYKQANEDAVQRKIDHANFKKIAKMMKEEL